MIQLLLLSVVEHKYCNSFGINWIGLDTPCISKQGNCQDERDTCNGEYQSNLCGGTATRQCCVPASAGILTCHNQIANTTIIDVWVSTWYFGAFHVSE